MSIVNKLFLEDESEQDPQQRERLNQVLKDAITKRHWYIEIMAAAYFSQTNISPDEVELVEVREENMIHWYFKERIKETEKNGSN